MCEWKIMYLCIKNVLPVTLAPNRAAYRIAPCLHTCWNWCESKFTLDPFPCLQGWPCTACTFALAFSLIHVLVHLAARQCKVEPRT